MSVTQYEHHQINPEEDFNCEKCRTCKKCHKKIAKNHKKLCCTVCKQHIHIKCNKLTSKDFANLNSNDKQKLFYCIDCTTEIFPFSSLNDNQFYMTANKGILNSENVQLDLTLTEYQKEVCNNLNTLINNNAFDLDTENDTEDVNEEILPAINCEYYTIDEFTSAKFNSAKNFSVLHLNIHSIQRHIDEFRVILSLLNFKFDIICITESKIEKNVKPVIDISISGYKDPESTPTESTKGGVLIYVREDLVYKIRTDLQIYKPKQLESLFVEIVNKKTSNDIVGVVYRHPCMDESEFLDDHIKPLVEKLSSNNKKIYIAGDFNFNLLNIEKHTETSEFFEVMMSNFLLPVINKPTKINRLNSSVIDNIFTSNLHPDTKSGNLSLNLSDGHLPSFLITPKPNQNHLPKKHNLYMRDMRNFRTESFLDDFNEVDWDETINVTECNVNKSMTNFLGKFNTILEKHAPIRKKTQKEYKQTFKPWITNELNSKIKEKAKAFKKYMKCKQATQKTLHYQAFKVIKNEITRDIRKKKKEYYQKYFTKHAKNLKKIWKGIKSIINVKSKSFDTPTCLEVGNETVTDVKQVADSFNDYFTKIADTILNKRKYNGNKSYRDFLSNRLLEEFAFSDCHEQEIEDVISSLKNNALGPNSIPTSILLSIKSVISVPLKNIFNLSFHTGTHPEVLRIAKTIPIYKKGSRLLVSNFRPISLLSNIIKILENVYTVEYINSLKITIVSIHYNLVSAKNILQIMH